MKALYLAGSIIFTVFILILSFENIGATCNNLNFLIFPVKSNPTFLALGIAVIGVLTGALYHAFIVKVLEDPEEKEEDVF